MRRINKTYEIVNNTIADFKTGTQQHLENAVQESAHMLLKSIFKNFVGSNGSICILQGCVNTGSGANYIISSGVISYKDPNSDEIELFYVNASTFTVTGGNVAVAVINTASYAGNVNQGDVADPTGMSDNTTQNIHDIRTIDIINGNSGSPNFIGTFASFITMVLTNRFEEDVIIATNHAVANGVSEVIYTLVAPCDMDAKSLALIWSVDFAFTATTIAAGSIDWGIRINGVNSSVFGSQYPTSWLNTQIRQTFIMVCAGAISKGDTVELFYSAASATANFVQVSGLHLNAASNKASNF